MSNTPKSVSSIQSKPDTRGGLKRSDFVTPSPRHSVTVGVGAAASTAFANEPADEWRDEYGRGGPVRSNEPERDWFFERSAASEGDAIVVQKTSSPARRRASSLRGKGPKGYRPRDDRIQELVCERLTEDPALDASEVSISVECGIVKASGAIPEAGMRDVMINDIREVHGVIGVVDHVLVEKTRS